MANPVTDSLCAPIGSAWQPDADTLDTNIPVNATAMGNGQPGDLDGELRRIKSEIRAESLIKSWERWKGLLNLAANDFVAFIFSDANHFNVNDNFTHTNRRVAVVGRRVKALLSGSTIYGTIVSATFSTPFTTVGVLWDSGAALDATLVEVQFGAEDRATFQREWKATKSVDESLPSSTLLNNDNELFLTTVPVDVYDLRAKIYYSSASGAGFKAAFSLPNVGNTMLWYPIVDGVTQLVVNQSGVTDLPSIDGTLLAAEFSGTIVMNVAGIVQFQWCQVVGDPVATVVYAGSTLVLTPL